MGSNYQHLLTLGLRRMAAVLWNLCRDYCAFCPRNRLRTCSEDCRAGILDWLKAPYIPDSEIWKETRK